MDQPPGPGQRGEPVRSLRRRVYHDRGSEIPAERHRLGAGQGPSGRGWRPVRRSPPCCGRVPGELEQAWQSCNTVARALRGYSSGLRPVVAALRSLAYQAEEAQGTVRATQAAREQAIRTGQASCHPRMGRTAGRSRSGRRRPGASPVEAGLGEFAPAIRRLRAADPAGARPQSVHREGLLSDLRRYAATAGHVGWGWGRGGRGSGGQGCLRRAVSRSCITTSMTTP